MLYQLMSNPRTKSYPTRNCSTAKRSFNHSRVLANISEDENGYQIQLSTPGISKENISIQVEGNELNIKAEVSSENRAVEYLRKEFDYSQFKRTFLLPEDANTENISASSLNGILNISIAKREEAKPKSITIK